MSRTVVLHREKGQVIREEAARHARLRRKYFWLWLVNSRPVMAALTALMVVMFVTMTFGLLGANGLYVVVYLATFVGVFACGWQFFAAEPGYTIDDWKWW